MKHINRYEAKGGFVYEPKGQFVELGEFEKMYNAAVKAKELIGTGKTDDALKLLTRETCRHDYATRNVGRCVTEYTCKICGKFKVIDSGD